MLSQGHRCCSIVLPFETVQARAMLRHLAPTLADILGEATPPTARLTELSPSGALHY
jgi:hypothetical protein